MHYAASLPFSGNPDDAFRLAEASLTAISFRLTERSSSSLEAVGPGMNNTRQSALVGASRVRITNGRGDLSLEAELGGVKRMSRFVTLFPVGLVLSLAIVLGGVFGTLFGPGIWMVPVAVSSGGLAIVWLVLGPLMARGIRRRTCQALDALLASMVVAGEAA